MGRKLTHNLFTITVLFFSILGCFGQKFTADDFRIVNGRLYNIERSTNWFQSPRLEVRRVMTTNAVLAQAIEVKVIRDAPQVDRMARIGGFVGGGGGPVLGDVIGEKVTYGRKYVVFNLPSKKRMARTRFEFVAMSLGFTNLNDEAIEMLDYGLPNTPENRVTLQPRQAPQP